MIRIWRTRKMFPADAVDVRIIHDPKAPYGERVLSRDVLLDNGEVWRFVPLPFNAIFAWPTRESPWGFWRIVDGALHYGAKS